jgi:hypothetical protein
MQRSTTADRSPPMGLSTVCHQFIEMPSGNQPPVIGK